MTTIIIISFVVLSIYIIYAIYKTNKKLNRLPESLSETYYILEDKGFIFQLVMCFTAFSLIVPWIEYSNILYQFLAFLSCGSIMFISVAPSFRIKLEGIVHYTSAVICGVSAFIWQILEGFWDVQLFFGLLCFCVFLKYKQYMWWLELAIIGSLYFNLLRII